MHSVRPDIKRAVAGSAVIVGPAGRDSGEQLSIEIPGSMASSVQHPIPAFWVL